MFSLVRAVNLVVVASIPVAARSAPLVGSLAWGSALPSGAGLTANVLHFGCCQDMCCETSVLGHRYNTTPTTLFEPSLPHDAPSAPPWPFVLWLCCQQ